MKHESIVKIIISAMILFVSGCDLFDSDGIRELTYIYSYNLETGIISQHCKIGFKFEGSQEGDVYGEFKYDFDSDGTNFISTFPYIFDNDLSWGDHINIYMFDINTRETITRIVDSLPEIYSNPYQIAYSNDESKITFSDSLIYTVNIDGSDLTSHSSGRYPTFSPDDSKLLFVDENESLSTIDLGNGEIKQIHSDGTIRYPSFNPDGKSIYYFSDKVLKKFTIADSSITSLYSSYNLYGYTIKYSESGDRKIFGNSDEFYSIDENDVVKELEEVTESADISPDGTKIAFHYQSSLLLMDFDESNRTVLSRATTEADNFTFTKDGSKILFINQSSN